MNSNPFRYGPVVEGEFFTNRIQEQIMINQILKSNNHLILIAPRRYGKTSLIKQVVSKIDRPIIFIDLQLVISVQDLAVQLLRKVNRLFPFEHFKSLLAGFRVNPTVHLNPVTNEIDISFLDYVGREGVILEDVMNMFDRIGMKGKKPIVIFDEFQDIKRLDLRLDFQLRAIIQHHQHVNYIFMGSIESMMREIFEKKKSPFYHFGSLMTLDKIPLPDFQQFLTARFSQLTKVPNEIVDRILEITKCHPYYTQQLASIVWNLWPEVYDKSVIVDRAIDFIIETHGYDYQRIWQNFNRTDRSILLLLAQNPNQPFSKENLVRNGFMAASTLYSGIRRLLEQGYLVRENAQYVFDDPFFRLWIINRRNNDL